MHSIGNRRNTEKYVSSCEIRSQILRAVSIRVGKMLQRETSHRCSLFPWNYTIEENTYSPVKRSSLTPPAPPPLFPSLYSSVCARACPLLRAAFDGLSWKTNKRPRLTEKIELFISVNVVALHTTATYFRQLCY